MDAVWNPKEAWEPMCIRISTVCAAVGPAHTVDTLSALHKAHRSLSRFNEPSFILRARNCRLALGLNGESHSRPANQLLLQSAFGNPGVEDLTAWFDCEGRRHMLSASEA